jgi:hypothetical protein
MQISDGQATEVREIAEIEVQADLRRAAHKIAWARMNGSIDTVNPFLEATLNRFASKGMGRTTSSRPARRRG